MQIARFDDSFARIFGEQVRISEAGDTFFVAFYDAFLGKSPQIAALFSRTNMTRQASMLRRSLYEFTNFYVTGTVSEDMRRLAALHQKLGIPVDLYDLWMDALMDTVAEFDGEFDELTEYAWRLALTPGITYFKFYASLSEERD